eukprot:6566652-Pyramimonas_sp.AAC.1
MSYWMTPTINWIVDILTIYCCILHEYQANWRLISTSFRLASFNRVTCYFEAPGPQVPFQHLHRRPQESLLLCPVSDRRR